VRRVEGEDVEPSEAVARESIRDLVARYNFYGDRGDLDSLGALFSQDGVLEFDMGGPPRRATGPAGITELLGSVVAGWAGDAEARQGPRWVRHFVATHVIDLVDEELATGSAYVLVMRSTGVESVGRYQDHYVKERSVWRFSSRRARRDPS
jgi:ketosteroid isomerase-like protein